jgi:hypothetical protein
VIKHLQKKKKKKKKLKISASHPEQQLHKEEQIEQFSATIDEH